MLRVRQVFNNNVVLGIDEDDEETVALGRGIGFQAKPGDLVAEDRIERRFVPHSMSAGRIAALVGEIPPEEFHVVELIVRLAGDQLGADAAEHLLLPLADHIHFAVLRARSERPAIEYPLVWEVEHLYPAQTELGRAALRIVEDRLGVHLHESEAVPLALHFVNASLGSGDLSQTMRMTRWVGVALERVRQDFGVTPDRASTARFVTHLRHLFVRAGSPERPAGRRDDLHKLIQSARPCEHASAARLATQAREQFGMRLDEDEVGYLALHIARLAARPDEGADC